jgi:hypothetical protein
MWPVLLASAVPGWRARGVECWGAFHGLFGVASSELFLLTHSADGTAAIDGLLSGATVRETHELLATVRPAEPPAPIEREGLFVFRYFDVAPGDVDEVVRLSAQAWTTFEASPTYRAEPLALFRPLPGSDASCMLLLTWYDGFGSWEASRTPPAAARENFARRQALTRGTVAFAMRRVGAR